MTFDTFCTEVTDALTERLPETAITRREVTKNNGTVLTAVCVAAPDSRLSPTIYLNDYYERTSRGEVAFSHLIEELVTEYRSALLTNEDALCAFTDFEAAKPNIVFRLVNRKLNAVALEDLCHIDYLDLAITFHCMVSVHEDNDASFAIHNSHTTLWDVTTKELYTLAMANTARLLPPCFSPMTDILAMHKIATDEPFSPTVEDLSFPMYVLTNKKATYGAAAMLLPNALENAAELLEDDLVLLPSSIHEMIVLPASVAPEDALLNSYIQSINEDFLSPMDILSDHCYRYTRADGKVSSDV